MFPSKPNRLKVKRNCPRTKLFNGLRLNRWIEVAKINEGTYIILKNIPAIENLNTLSFCKVISVLRRSIPVCVIVKYFFPCPTPTIVYRKTPSSSMSSSVALVISPRFSTTVVFESTCYGIGI